jgi:hypothetical protein
MTDYSDDDYYTGIPPNFDVWISSHVYGTAGNPMTEHSRYQIFQTTEGDYALQESRLDFGKGKGGIPTSGFKHRVAATGDLEFVSAKHEEYTGKPPFFK